MNINQKVRWSHTSRSTRKSYSGNIVCEVPSGYVPNVSAWKREGWNTDSIKHAENSSGRSRTSYMVAKDGRLYWPTLIK